MLAWRSLQWLGPMHSDASTATRTDRLSLLPLYVPRLGRSNRIVDDVFSARRHSHLDPIYGGQTRPPCRLPEPRHAVEAVVIGDSQGSIAQFHRPVHERFGMGSAIEERKVRVAMEFGVHKTRY